MWYNIHTLRFLHCVIQYSHTQMLNLCDVHSYTHRLTLCDAIFIHSDSYIVWYNIHTLRGLPCGIQYSYTHRFDLHGTIFIHSEPYLVWYTHRLTLCGVIFIHRFLFRINDVHLTISVSRELELLFNPATCYLWTWINPEKLVVIYV